MLLFATFYSNPAFLHGGAFHPHATIDHAQSIAMINMLFGSIARFNHPARFAILTCSKTDLSGVRFDFRRLDIVMRPGSLMLDRAIGQRRQIERLGHGETVAFVDTDILVQEDISALGRLDFDVAVTTRKSALPINGGVLFARNNGSGHSLQFFDQIIERCITTYPNDLQWNCDQLALRDIVALDEKTYEPGSLITVGDGIRLALLPPRFNCSPSPRSMHFEQIVPDTAIVHFKGKRKDFMADYYSLLTQSDDVDSSVDGYRGANGIDHPFTASP